METKARGLAMKLYCLSTKYKRLGGVLTRLNRVLNGCDIPPSATIDPSVVLFHNGLGVVIHEKTVIGKNTAIYQNVTIGGRGQLGHPTIGEGVFIGAGAVIIGGVHIGNNARIGANAVVLVDVPDNMTAVGVPARIVKSNEAQFVNPLTIRKE